MPSGWPSKFNGKEADSKIIGGCGVYPIKITNSLNVPGPAPRIAEDSDEAEDPDILDEVLYYFKARMMMASFPIEGPADRLTLYLTLYIQQMIKRLCPTVQGGPVLMEDAMRILNELATEEKIIGIGDSKFPFTSSFPTMTGEQRAQWDSYILQLRVELAQRVFDKVYAFPEVNEKKQKTGNKFWLVFGKQKFLEHCFEKFE